MASEWASQVLVLCWFGLLGLAAGLGRRGDSPDTSLDPSSAALLTLSALVVGIVGAFSLRDVAAGHGAAIWLAALAIVHIALGRLRSRPLAVAPPMRRLLLVLGVILADVAIALTANAVVSDAGVGRRRGRMCVLEPTHTRAAERLHPRGGCARRTHSAGIGARSRRGSTEQLVRRPARASGAARHRHAGRKLPRQRLHHRPQGAVAGRCAQRSRVRRDRLPHSSGTRRPDAGGCLGTRGARAACGCQPARTLSRRAMPARPS